MKNHLFKWFNLILLPLLFVSFFRIDAIAEGQMPAGFREVARNSRHSLYIKDESSEIAVKDNRTGYIWYSNPPDRANDKIVKGPHKMNLESQLLVTFATDKNKLQLINNRVGSVSRNSMRIDLMDDGVIVTYDFSRPTEEFIIPVKYTLQDDCLKAEIITSEIVEKGKQKIISMTLLPFFGAAGTENNGYMFVPDGSGALIYFNNGKTEFSDYSQHIYGRNPLLSKVVDNKVEQNVKLPVFGVKNGDNAFLAVVDKGVGAVNASISGKLNSYNYVNMEFEYRDTDSAIIGANTWSPINAQVIPKSHYKSGNFEIRYYFLDGTNADYSGMAARYRRYLADEKGLTPQIDQHDDIPFYIEVYGAVKTIKHFLGIPFEYVQPLTTYKDCINILEQLRSRGVKNIVLNYKGWMKGGLNEKVPSKIAPERKLGGYAGFSELVEYCDNNGIQLFPNVEFQKIRKSGNGYSSFSFSAKSPSKVPAFLYEYKLSTYLKNREIEPFHLMTPAFLSDIMKKFLGNYKRLEINKLSLGSLGSLVYPDYGKREFIDYGDSIRMITEALEQARKEGLVLLAQEGNAYILPYIGHVMDAPVSSSRYMIEDECIPFYQMALHGYIPYSIPSLNLSYDSKKLFLRAIETGSSIRYVWNARNTDDLLRTPYNYIYSSLYTDWIDEACRQYKEINGIMKEIQGKEIVEHLKLADNVYKTVYDNDFAIIVNYNPHEVLIDGRMVEGLSYIIEH